MNLVKSSSGPLRYRSETRLSSALWDPQHKQWGSHNALDNLVSDLYLRGPEDDLTRVETCSLRFMYIYTINKER